MKLSINENIRNYRKSFNLTQEQLAEAVGVTVGAVSKWESASSNPDIHMLPVLADFFEISVDVLLGYQLQYRTPELVSNKIYEMRLAKQFEEGQAEAEKALQRFPNSFDVVYQSAVLYHITGIEKNDQPALHKALDLYKRACCLIAQNTDSSISELSLQVSIGELYVSLNDVDHALEHLKKYNFCGINNGFIGYLLAQNEKTKEALPYLSECFLECFADLFRTTIGLANCYSFTGDYINALDVLQWMLTIIESLKTSNKISYLDKAEVVLLTGCSHVAAEMKDLGKAEEYLRHAAAIAKMFDAAPDYDVRKIKYYHGKAQTLSDDFGETAMEGIEKVVLSDDKADSLLIDIWRKIQNEAM